MSVPDVDLHDVTLGDTLTAEVHGGSITGEVRSIQVIGDAEYRIDITAPAEWEIVYEQHKDRCFTFPTEPGSGVDKLTVESLRSETHRLDKN